MKRFFIALLMIFCFVSIIATVTQAAALEGKKIGVMLSWATHEWYVSVMDGFKERAKQLGIDYTITDSENDLQKGVSILETFIEEGVDGILLIPSTYPGYEAATEKAKEVGIPVISDVVEMDNVLAFAGNEQFNMTRDTGREVGKYIMKNWPRSKQVNVLTVNIPAFPNLNGRTDGFLVGLIESGLKYNWVQEVDGGGNITQAMEVSVAALTAHPEVNLVFGINDDSMFGALKAAEQLGLKTKEMIFVGTGLEGPKSRETLLQGGPYRYGTAMFPYTQGVGYVNLFAELFKGNKIPYRTVWPSKAIAKENFHDFFDKSLKEKADPILKITITLSDYPIRVGWDRNWYKVYKSSPSKFKAQYKY
jgi:ABC-type sugar transport system substrate-binding protein